MSDAPPPFAKPLSQPATPAQYPPGYPPAGAAYGHGYPYPPYQTPVHAAAGTGRPGIVTAIGVISIIVASLSIIGTALTGFWGIRMQQLVKQTTTMARTRAAAAAPPPPPVVSNPSPVLEGAPPAEESRIVTTDRGHAEDDRELIARVFGTMEVMTPELDRQLHGLLARDGKDIAPIPSGGTTASRQAAIRDAVSRHGELPSADRKTPNGVFFQLPAGEMSLYHDRAIFRWTDRSKPLIRSIAPKAPAPGTTSEPEPELPPTPPQPPAGGQVDPFASDPNDPFAAPTDAQQQPAPGSASGVLTPAQVQSVIQKVQAAAKNQLNPQQVAALRSALSDPNQNLVPPDNVWSPVSVVQMNPDGSAIIKLTNAAIVMDSAGAIQDQFMTNIPAAPLRSSGIAMVIIESALSAIVAMFLMYAGIQALRQSPRAGRCHLLYALVKIPLAVVAAIGLTMLMNDVISFFELMGLRGSDRSGVLTFALWMAGLGVIYPIVLLIVLHVPSVKAYFKAGANVVR